MDWSRVYCTGDLKNIDYSLLFRNKINLDDNYSYFR